MINKDSNNNKDIKKEPVNWYLVDAKDQILGRLSSFLATRLMGKHKVSYSDNTCLKDKIIVINAQKVVLTGKKIHKKKYWHTGYPGGIKNKTFKEILNSKNSTSVLKNAVRRMLKSNTLDLDYLDEKFRSKTGLISEDEIFFVYFGSINFPDHFFKVLITLDLVFF